MSGPEVDVDAMVRQVQAMRAELRRVPRPVGTLRRRWVNKALDALREADDALMELQYAMDDEGAGT